MLCCSDLEHEHKLVLRAIAGAHSSDRLIPDAQVLHLSKDVATRLEEFAHVAPIHTHKGNRTVPAARRGSTQTLREEVDELAILHLAGRESELARDRCALDSGALSQR